MPRISTRETRTVKTLLSGNRSEAIRMTGMTRGTFYNRIDNPGELRLKEIGLLAHSLSDDEIVRIVRDWA